MQSPWGQNVKTQAAEVAPAERLGWVLGQYARMAGQGMTNVAFEEGPDAWHLRVDPCGSCAGVEGATAPICSATGEVIHLIVEKTLGRRARVEETTCRAMGAHLCQFAVYKS
jgi:predicted hydrocarbon binding protein